MTIDLAQLMELQRTFLPGLLGMRYTEASKDRLVAELTIRDELYAPWAARSTAARSWPWPSPSARPRRS